MNSILMHFFYKKAITAISERDSQLLIKIKNVLTALSIESIKVL